MTKMTINITKDILYESRNCKNESFIKDKIGQNCAIGKAIFNLFGDLSWVDNNNILIYREGFTSCILEEMISKPSDYQIYLPHRARTFIEEFDNNSPDERANMQPFSFDVEIPDEVIELVGGVEEVYKILEESKTMQLTY